MGFYLPKELEKENRWLLWRFEDGKKVPYSAQTFKKVDPLNEWLWASYARAKSIADNSEFYNGIGFAFTPDAGLTFIDLDHCIDEEGNLNPLADSIVNRGFHGTYSEYSQSGSGLHIVCKGTIPRDFVYPNDYYHQRIEVYSHKHYMAFTGDAFEASDIAPMQPQLDRLYERYCPRQTETQERIDPAPDSSCLLSDAEVLRRCRKRKCGNPCWKDFSALFDYGRHSYTRETDTGEVVPDNHPADIRLSYILVSCNGCNEEQATRLFLQSALGQRDKVRLRPDYLHRTMQRAIAEYHKNNPGRG